MHQWQRLIWKNPPLCHEDLYKFPMQYKHARISNWLLTNSLDADKSTPEGAIQTKKKCLTQYDYIHLYEGSNAYICVREDEFKGEARKEK